MNATDGKYVIIHDWMNKLGLSANEKIALALVYGYTIKEGVSCVKNACLEEWVGCTRKTANNTMDSLEEKGLIIRGQEIVNGKVANTYKLGEEKLQSMGVKITTIHGKNYQVRGKNLPGNMEKITPYKDINKDNIVVEEAHAHAYEEILNWVTDNEAGLEMMLHRNGLISAKTPLEEMREIIRPYAKEYYEQQQMNGGDDIQRRGRRDIKQHFSQWLPIRIKKEQQQKQKDNETSTDPITRAMQDFAAGWDNAERTGM
jgi:biotin operon repressor